MKGKKCIFYIGRKLLSILVSLWLLSFAVFFVARLAPGDPLVSYYGERAERMTAEEREMARERLLLTGSPVKQYVRWMKNALRGDFGISFKYKRSVPEVIAERLGNTLVLGGCGFVLIFGLAVLIGMLCALFADSRTDRFLCRLGTILSAVPEFWVALVLILIFAVKLRVLPASGAYTIGIESFADRVRHLILPLTVVVSGHLWYYAYMVRNMLLDEMTKDYVLLAKSKGLGINRILFCHCMRNVLPGYLSIMAVSVPHILGGTYIVENVFSYPGIGTLCYESARYQDYNLLMVLAMLTGAVVIVCNLFAQMITDSFL